MKRYLEIGEGCPCKFQPVCQAYLEGDDQREIYGTGYIACPAVPRAEIPEIKPLLLLVKDFLGDDCHGDGNHSPLAESFRKAIRKVKGE